jgi:hypothetical protein
MRMLRARLFGIVLTLAAFGVVSATPALADPPGEQGKKKKKQKKKGKKGRGAQAEAESAPAASESAPAGEPARERDADASAKRAQDAARAAAQEASSGVNSQVVKEGDTNVKVMEFTGLDIEGRLKSPQLLYFVNRVHAEFERPKLPHRSFMSELSRSTQRDPFR